MPGFHEQQFDEETQLKLDLFRGYIRKWLPVFLTRYRDGRRNFQRANVFDFFSGPGYDAKGNPGSPIILLDELEQFCRDHQELLSKETDVRLVFNDIREDSITRLKAAVAQAACPETCCRIEYMSLPFREALEQSLPDIRRPGSANLLIMDQFGVKEVTPDIVGKLAECSATDILFFISSSFIRRFIDTAEIAGKFDMTPAQVKGTEYADIHRSVCEYFREKLAGREYYLAPFSIKKGSNIYGVIFGSGKLRGLEKFLEVCWDKDTVTGEANYNIDQELAWPGRGLFEEFNVIRKVDLFQRDLREFLSSETRDNRQVYRFCLTHGFLPRHAKEVLGRMQEKGTLTVTRIADRRPARRNAFYVTWENYDKAAPQVVFSLRSQP